MRASEKFGVGAIVVLAAVSLMVGPVAASARPAMLHDQTAAGYLASAAAPITTFSGSVTVPTVTCPATGSTQFFPEVSVTDPSGASAGMDLFIDCFDGNADYNNAAVVVSNFPSFGDTSTSIAPGDTVKFSMSENVAKATVTVKLTDAMQNFSGSATVQHFSPSFDSVTADSSFCCQDKNGNVSPIPSFTPITFGSLRFNGTTLSTMSPTEYEMFNGTTLQVATSKISAKGSFTNTFKHA